jgi:hypothetical protein
METGCNLAESSKECYGSASCVLLLMMMMMTTMVVIKLVEI